MSHYPNPESRSARLFERARTVVPGGNSRNTIFHKPYPVFAQSGDGCRVRDVDGVERLDFINNYTSLLHGHRHPAIIEAIQAQLALGTCFANPTEAEVRLAELLVERVPSFDQVRFTNSGTEAVMMAIKAARAHTGRSKIAKCEGLYHGCYDVAEVSLGAHPGNWGDGAPAATAYSKGTPSAVLNDVVVIPFNEPETAEEILSRHAKDLAAVLIDLMPSRVGFVRANPPFLTMLDEFRQTSGALLIVDEVISFRMGMAGAQGMMGVQPDLTALGKIIGGGLPVGAVAGRAEVMSVFDHAQGPPALPHGGTFNGNPLSMAAGRAAMELMTPEAYERLNRLGGKAIAELREAFARAGVTGQVTGEGSLFAVNFKEKPPTTFREAFVPPEESERVAALHRYCLDQGIILGSRGAGALSTPMGEAEVERLAEVFLGALKALPLGALKPLAPA